MIRSSSSAFTDPELDTRASAPATRGRREADLEDVGVKPLIVLPIACLTD